MSTAKKQSPTHPKGNAGKRAKRYLQVSTQIGGFAAQVSTRRLLKNQNRRQADAEALRIVLGRLKGPLVKAAQMLATIPNALPPEYAQALGQLQTHAPPMPWAFVKRRMRSELGPQWKEQFTNFSPTTIHAASLGQVHQAQRPGDPRLLACKLQYPDMESTIEADMRQLQLALKVLFRLNQAIDPRNILKELHERLHEELDYYREAKNLRLFAHLLKNEPGVQVPIPLPELSTKRLLTMTWLKGQPLLTFLEQNPDQNARNLVALHLFRAWYVPLYHCGIIHGDPHLGNYTIRPDLTVNLFDFGCARIFPPRFVSGVIDLYHALSTQDEERAAHAYENWGFQKLSKELLTALNLWASFLYRPLLHDRTQAIIPTDDPKHGANLARRVHAALRSAGGVAPPREFVLMDRAAIGLGSVFSRLNAQVNWHRLFHELIDGFDGQILARRQKEALKTFDLTTTDSPSP